MWGTQSGAQSGFPDLGHPPDADIEMKQHKASF
jgi:hypothetical protein